MKDKIFVLFSCDQWKSEVSMHLICVSTDYKRMLDVIESEIAEDNMSFYFGNSEEDQSLSSFLKFREDSNDAKFINSYLEYGHLEIVEDGEVL